VMTLQSVLKLQGGEEEGLGRLNSLAHRTDPLAMLNLNPIAIAATRGPLAVNGLVLIITRPPCILYVSRQLLAMKKNTLNSL